MEHRRQNRELIFRIVAVILVVVLLLSAGMLLLQLWEMNQDEPSEDPGYSSGVIQVGGETYRLRDDVETVLMIGIDKYEDAVVDSGYRNDQRADFVLLLAVDHTNKTYSAIHIDRDTMAQMNVLGVAGEKVDSVCQQLALSHTYGNGREVSCRNTADAVSELLSDTPIRHYMSLTMDSVPAVNDAVGGVTLTVQDDFSKVDPSLVKGKTMTLTGQQALTYVRARSGMEEATNSARMARQKQYMDALVRQMHKEGKTNDQLFADLFKKLDDSEDAALVTDCTTLHLQNLCEELMDYDYQQIYTLEGVSRVKDGMMEFYPDSTKTQELVLKLLYEKE